jgi:hypothetical protein
MKIKFEKFTRPTTILGYFDFEMKYIIVKIEYKYCIESGQLNLREVETKFKVKDKNMRIFHKCDYLKDFAQKFFKRKIKQRIKKQLELIPQVEIKKMNYVWWESK